MEFNPVSALCSPINNGSLFETVFTAQPNIQVPFTDIAYDSDHLNASSHLLEQTQDSIDPALMMVNHYSIDVEPLSLFAGLPPSVHEGLPDEWPKPASSDAAHAASGKEDENLPSDSPAFGPEPQATSTQFLEPPSTNVSAGTPATAPPTPSSPARDKAPRTRSLSPRNSRYACEDCGIFSKTKRDHKRHLNTNKHKTNVQIAGSNMSSPPVTATGVHCPVTGCKYHRSTSGGRKLSREDNLWRHIRKAHGMEICG
ncbi:hypothetical protein B0H65DRAFT_245577 [Neurospora tetraspora]|uniref:C2H2-type domain-containing protein n=1 Tax=Neurospora tetraspora TaxID=94610 RepID=A0AAE0MR05_9PEZI|nr:hypothetical protein B0H65DRAFT_245577 [Neurospora tetraspora]